MFPDRPALEDQRVLRRGEAGETLIELMATVILLGLAVTLIISGIWTAIAVSDQNQKASRVNLYLHDYAEQLKSPLDAYAYIECATKSGGSRPYPNYQGLLPAGFTVKVVDTHPPVIRLIDLDPNDRNPRVVKFDLNAGNMQIAHGINRVLRPLDID